MVAAPGNTKKVIIASVPRNAAAVCKNLADFPVAASIILAKTTSKDTLTNDCIKDLFQSAVMLQSKKLTAASTSSSNLTSHSE